MKKQNAFIGIAAFTGILILIIDCKTALIGAREGIRLCTQTVVPALFPFFVLSSAVTGSLSGLSLPFLRPAGRLFRIPRGAEPLLIAAFLGGYPVGAQAVAAAYRHGQLSKDQAERMLSYCNNPGPSFLFGMVSFLFSDKRMVWLLWGTIVLSALLVARIYPCENSDSFVSGKADANVMELAVKAMGCVCGWIIVFRVLITFLSRWFLWILPVAAQKLLIGLLELSNGCYELSQLASPELRFLICGCILSFGGLCVTMQTASVIGELSMKHYWTGKSLQTFFSLIICISILYHLWFIPIAALVWVCVPWKYKKRSSFPRKAIV